MSDALRLLRAIASGGHDAEPGLPSRELRFIVEAAGAADIPALRGQVEDILPESRFSIEPFEDPAVANFAILRFPGIERTVPPRELFSMAYALCDLLELVSAEPDLGTRFFHEQREADLGGLEGARFGEALCWVDAPPPPDRHWALKAARIEAAWSQGEGAGILVAQPDSGIADHAELEAGMFRLDLASNILDGSNDPTDPLRARTPNPGHGSATASVLASRRGGALVGAAPAAKVIPIRCLDDVKVFDAAPVTAAILHAKKVGAHVVSMSLGGVPSRAMHAAIKAAVAADMIVIAAAGNCVRTVVWPARYQDVIAVAGNNAADAPWKGSSRGPAIDITAPAELVWRASRSAPSDPLDKIGAGQGTSFATALTAGAAALWLSAHGHRAVVAEARRRGVAVQRLFRAALRKSARRPEYWNIEDFGPGLLDAEALVSLALEDIPSLSLEHASERPSIVGFLVEEFGDGAPVPDFDWPRYQAELATIALAQADLGLAPADLSAETKWAGTRPSPALAAAVERAADRRLAPFGELNGRTAIVRAPAAGRPLLSTSPGASQVMAGHLESAVRRRLGELSDADVRRSLEDLKALMSSRGGRPGVDNRILGAVEDAGKAIARGNLPAGPQGRIGLEALVELKGRPALRVRNGTIDLDDPRAKEWRDQLIVALSGDDIKRNLKSVGRIDDDSAHIGTGFVVGPGVVLTNRHVAQAFAAPAPRLNDPDHWEMMSGAVTIDFAEEPSSQTSSSRFRVTGVVGWGARNIDYDEIDFACLDAALLSVETSNSAGTPLPGGGCLVGNPAMVDKWRPILVVGYPARPTKLPRNMAGDYDEEVIDRLAELYGADYGTKYVAPGEIKLGTGSLTGDVDRNVFTHDGTTMVGNSGSAILGINGQQDFIGLHFGGAWRRENYAHALPMLREWAALRPGKVHWCPPA